MKRQTNHLESMRTPLTDIENGGAGVDELDKSSNGPGVAGSCFTSDDGVVKTDDARGRGGLTGALPLAFSLGFNSSMN